MTLLGARSRAQPQSVGVNTIAYMREQQVGDAPLFGPRAVVFGVAFIERRAAGHIGRRVRAPRSGNPDGQTSTTLKETAPSQIHEPRQSWSFQPSQTPGGCRSDGGFRATHSRRTFERTLRANFAAPAVYNIGALYAGTAWFSDYLRARQGGRPKTPSPCLPPRRLGPIPAPSPRRPLRHSPFAKPSCPKATPPNRVLQP